MIEFPDSPTTGDIFAAGGASWRWDGVKWTVDTSGPLLAQGEVLGNPNPADAEAIPADIPLMVRAGFGDGVAGQALLSGGPAVDPAWSNLPTAPKPLNFIFTIEQAMTNGEETHRFPPPACSFPAGAAGSSGTAGTAATGSTTMTLKKNGTGFATFAWAGAGTSATVTLPSTTAFNGTTDILTLEGQATADATLAKIGINLAGSRT